MNLKNKIAFAIIGSLAGTLSAKFIRSFWRRLTGEDPPDPNDPKTPPVVALVWTALAAIILAGGKILVNRFGASHLSAKTKPVIIDLKKDIF